MSTPQEGPVARVQGPTRMRTSDEEREKVAELLRAAVGEGRLDLTEGDERLGKAYVAQFRDQLTPLTADLPGAGWDALGRTPEALGNVQRRLRQHGLLVGLTAGVLITLWVLSGAQVFWPLLPLIFLGIGLARHVQFARVVRSSGSGWPAAPGTPPAGAWQRGPGGPGQWDRGQWGRNRRGPGPWGPQ